jgi:hypothetical protein
VKPRRHRARRLLLCCATLSPGTRPGLSFGTWKPVGEVFASPALQRLKNPRTTADGIEGDGKGRQSADAQAQFNFGRHRWLCRVARDAELSGATLRTAVLLWEHLNSKYGYAWPSLTYIATELKMHKSTQRNGRIAATKRSQPRTPIIVRLNILKLESCYRGSDEFKENQYNS